MTLNTKYLQNRYQSDVQITIVAPPRIERVKTEPKEPMVQQNIAIQPKEPVVQQNVSIQPKEPVVQQNVSIQPKEPVVQQNVSIQPKEPVVHQNVSIQSKEPVVHQNVSIQPKEPVVQQSVPIEITPDDSQESETNSGESDMDVSIESQPPEVHHWQHILQTFTDVYILPDLNQQGCPFWSSIFFLFIGRLLRNCWNLKLKYWKIFPKN